ncbi:cytochrome P450 71AP13-like [Carya illinoinensis]|nr:cytochrome P450 71AP13-like [Carya illinoinensis]
MLEEFQVLLGGFSLADFFPSLEFVNSLTSRKSRLQKTFRSFDKLFDQLLSEHLDPERETEEHKDLVNVLLDIQKNGSGHLPITTDKSKLSSWLTITIEINISHMLLPRQGTGSDTASITLEWGMTELILKPKVMEIARAEVRNIVGDHRRVVSESDLPHLHYIKAAIKEILRFHPPAPVLVPRESTENVNIEGYDIPAKTRLFFNAWAIGRDSESWENQDTFQPERFMGSTVDFKGQHFELIPFGVGRRICPGITFGTAVIELALAQLLHSFDWYLPPGTTAENFDMKEVFGITTHRISDLTLVARPRFPVGYNKP